MSYIEDKRYTLPAKELKPGMHVLYRLNWYEVVAYHSEEKSVIITNGTAIESKVLHPNMSVTVKSE